MNYLENITTDISPGDFELLCVDLLSDALRDSAGTYSIDHNVNIGTPDGDYQIDILLKHQFANMQYITLVECKRHNSPIKREVVQLLYDKIRACGSHKGIVIATSGFQTGAIQFAEAHGIALIQVVNGIILNIQASGSPNIRWTNYPEHVPLMYDTKCEFPVYNLSDNGVNVLTEYLCEAVHE